MCVDERQREMQKRQWFEERTERDHERRASRRSRQAFRKNFEIDGMHKVDALEFFLDHARDVRNRIVGKLLRIGIPRPRASRHRRRPSCERFIAIAAIEAAYGAVGFAQGIEAHRSRNAARRSRNDTAGPSVP